VTLKSFEGQPSYMSSLFRVVNSEGVALEVRLLLYSRYTVLEP